MGLSSFLTCEYNTTENKAEKAECQASGRHRDSSVVISIDCQGKNSQTFYVPRKDCRREKDMRYVN